MTRNFILIFFLFLFIIPPVTSQAQSPVLLFVPNEGQWQEEFLYKGIAPFADIYLERSGITYVVSDGANAEIIHSLKERSKAPTEEFTLNYHSYKMNWIGANLNAKARPSKKQSFYHNYYLGNNKSNWKSNVGVYGNVDYEDLYPNIDLHISSNKGNAKYDFIVKPGGNPEVIQLAYEGLEQIHIDKGRLILTTSVGKITELAPYSFQYIHGELQEVPCEYVLNAKGEVYFHFPKGFDPSQTLTIDPTIVFATLTGSTADNWGFTATYDAQGNLYAAGIANGVGYPTTLGAFQLTFGGGSASTMPCDITISKFNASGSSLIYSTYLGGNADEMPHSLIVDQANNLIVAGKTLSTNFPVTSGAFATTNSGGQDFIISKFNSAGTALIASTYLGGSGDDGVNISSSFYGVQTTLSYNYGDGFRSEVLIDRLGNIYLSGSSKSTDFPITLTAAKSTLGGSQDGVFVKMNPSLSALLYSTYIGGSQADAAYVIALDTAQTHVYVAGGTSSADFHLSAMTGGYQSTYQGGLADGYICRFLNSGSYPLEKATFIGTGNYDQTYGIEVDLENNVYAMGQTLGNFPVTSGTYSNPGSPQYLIKLNPDLSSSIYSTVFGSGPSASPNISPVAFLVDTCQNVYISGWASPGISPGSSTNNLPITQDAFQSTTDGSDFYFIVLSKNALNLLFGSFFGSPGKSEHVDGGTSRFDPNGVVYQAICSSCGQGSAFPSTPGAYATQKGSNNCNLGAVKIAFNLGSVKAEANVTPNTAGCAPFSVQFGNTSLNALTYYWDFGDGTSSSTLATPTHTYMNPGNFTAMMVAINPNACKTRDTTYLNIVVSTDTIHADFQLTLADTCTTPNITIQNTSTPLPGGSFSTAQFHWDFGDGTTFNGNTPPVHFYQNPGIYTVTLVMTDPNACNSPDTIQKTIDITQQFVTSDFTLPTTLCAQTEIAFQNSSQNASAYLWDFGDGQQSTTQNPNHTYGSEGTYTIRLISSNPNTCNRVDSATQTITVFSKPTAAFQYSPIVPELNTPYTFHNQSQNANQYDWDFGDGTSSTDKDPIHTFQRSGDFRVCLTVKNEHGCTDKVCKTIRSEVQSLVDVPTAFSPNQDGVNDILYVRGYNVQSMVWKIFNRWGELVFESQDMNIGWNGTFKGKPQEMEVYAYILDVQFFDGSVTQKKGNVTLLR